MALWQFELSLVPASPILGRFGKIPAELPDEENDDWLWATQPPVEYPSVIESFSRAYPSWAADIRMWGEESGDRIHFIYEGDRVVGIACRLDLRAFSQSFARGVLRLAEFCGCLLVVGQSKLITPDWEFRLAAVRESNAMRFVIDPREFLEGLSSGKYKV